MIKIQKKEISKIKYHAEQAYPEECCGILLGNENDLACTIKFVVEFENNQDQNRKRRFLITPEKYMEAERISADLNMQLLGFYHSHPDHVAVPSAFDLEHALPWFKYIIISVVQGQSRSLTAWSLSETHEKFNEINLIVME